VLSQFAGAAKELDRALIVNPHEIHEVAASVEMRNAISKAFPQCRGRQQVPRVPRAFGHASARAEPLRRARVGPRTAAANFGRPLKATGGFDLMSLMPQGALLLSAGLLVCGLSAPAMANERGTVVGGVAGAVGGAAVGGPVGAVVGGLGGAVIGNAATNHHRYHRHYYTYRPYHRPYHSY
jgi:hypothetical protein